MPLKALFRTTRRVSRGVLGLLARPVRRAHGRHDVVMQPYRGFGSQREIFVIGRVFRQSTSSEDRRRDLRSHLRNIRRRIRRRPVAGAIITARYLGSETRVETDTDGYFRIRMRLANPPPEGREWHGVTLVMEWPEVIEATAQVFIPPKEARYVVISDIDDTVMFTGVANKLAMLWRLFVQGPDSRLAFPGVASLYRALHHGRSGYENNPMLYVSRGPWGIYDLLEEFFKAHDIPRGPILLLREWGISWKKPLPRRAVDHKRDVIENVLSIYDDLPFLLIGDSGQHDPEAYRQIAEAHPERVLAVYIRNVSTDRARIEEIERMIVPVVGGGSSVVLATDSLIMAEHAAGIGLIPQEAVSSVRDEIAAQGGAPISARRVVRTRPSLEEAAERVERGASHPEGEPPPGMVVQPARQRRPSGRRM